MAGDLCSLAEGSELTYEKEVYKGWKQEQVVEEDYKDVAQHIVMGLGKPKPIRC